MPGVQSRYGGFVGFAEGDAYRHDLEILRTQARSPELH
jgi:hypothetical protein